MIQVQLRLLLVLYSDILNIQNKTYTGVPVVSPGRSFWVSLIKRNNKHLNDQVFNRNESGVDRGENINMFKL